MKTFRELSFKGSPEQLSAFVNQVKNYAGGDWQFVSPTERWKEYLQFDYLGTAADRARVSIYTGSYNSKGELAVGNIVPLEKNQLSVDEYNAVLMRFYEDIIIPYKKTDPRLIVSQPTNDVFDPTTVISKTALEKLHRFCVSANKTTGASHPLDRERWFDFICQTVEDGKMFDSSSLANFLQDTDYWGENPEDSIGAIGNNVWDTEIAYELATEYADFCEILLYYRTTRGV